MYHHLRPSTRTRPAWSVRSNSRRKILWLPDASARKRTAPAQGVRLKRPNDVFVAGIRDLALHALAGRKGLSLYRDTKQIAEFFRVRHVAPDPRARRFALGNSFNPICSQFHIQ